jgi:hypothetical protein
MTKMVGAHGLPPEIIEYPLLMKWWPPSMAVAFLAFGGDARLLRSRSTERLWEHGPLSRMLAVEDEHTDRVLAAARRLERELKRGTVEARAALQRAYLISGGRRRRGRPAYVRIEPQEWGELWPDDRSPSGFSTLVDELAMDVLTMEGRPHLWNWEVRRIDVMRLPDDDTDEAARIAAIRNSLSRSSFRIAHLIREFESTNTAAPPLKQDRITSIRAAFVDRYRGGVGIRTVEKTMRTLSQASIAPSWT